MNIEKALAYIGIKPNNYSDVLAVECAEPVSLQNAEGTLSEILSNVPACEYETKECSTFKLEENMRKEQYILNQSGSIDEGVKLNDGRFFVDPSLFGRQEDRSAMENKKVSQEQVIDAYNNCLFSLLNGILDSVNNKCDSYAANAYASAYSTICSNEPKYLKDGYSDLFRKLEKKIEGMDPVKEVRPEEKQDSALQKMYIVRTFIGTYVKENSSGRNVKWTNNVKEARLYKRASDAKSSMNTLHLVEGVDYKIYPIHTEMEE